MPDSDYSIGAWDEFVVQRVKDTMPPKVVVEIADNETFKRSIQLFLRQ